MSNSDYIQGVPSNQANSIDIQVDRTGSGDREVVELGIPGGGTFTPSSPALYAGSLTATTTAAALPTQACSEVYIQNDPGNTVTVLVGNATAQPVALTPGSGASLQVSNTNLVSVKAASSTATVNWLARG